jgi:hypothetical protein
MTYEQLKNYYGILNLDLFESNQNTIRDSYLKLTEQFHPKRYCGEDLIEHLVAINEAYLVLSDTATKKRYDEALKNFNNCNSTLLDNLISAKRNKAEKFIASYFSGTQKKKTSFWKIVGIILLVIFSFGTLCQIVGTCSRQNKRAQPVNSTSTSLPLFTPPSNWNSYLIDDAFLIDIPPTLELRSEYDSYTQFLCENHWAITNADAVFQQKDLGKMNSDAFNTYCRIMVARYYVGENNADHHSVSPELLSEDYSKLRSMADSELGPWSYISMPTYNWIDIDGTKGINIAYSREGTNGEVICHIYLFFNYDEIAKIVTSYWKVDKQIWEQNVNNVIKTFRWSNPK